MPELGVTLAVMMVLLFAGLAGVAWVLMLAVGRIAQVIGDVAKAIVLPPIPEPLAHVTGEADDSLLDTGIHLSHDDWPEPVRRPDDVPPGEEPIDSS